MRCLRRTAPHVAGAQQISTTARFRTPERVTGAAACSGEAGDAAKCLTRIHETCATLRPMRSQHLIPLFGALLFACFTPVLAPSRDSGTRNDDALVIQDGETDATVDASPVATARCDPRAAFSPPVPLPGLATADNELAGSLSPDELTLYRGGSHAGSYDIFTATRNNIDVGFGPSIPVDPVNADTSERDPWISSDGRTMLFRTDRDGPDHIYVATRANAQVDFGMPTPLFGVQVIDGRDRMPHISVSSDGEELWFASDRDGPDFDVWTAKSNLAGFMPPSMAPKFSSADYDELHPVLSADKLTIYVSTTRDFANMRTNIWRSHRATADEQFSDLEPVNELNTAFDEFAFWMSPDGCRIYLQREQVERNGNHDILVATRSPQ
jgi:hypothetical protein